MILFFRALFFTWRLKATFETHNLSSIQCCIQSYFEAGIPVWDPRLWHQTLKKVKINSSKNTQMTIHDRNDQRERCFELFRMQNSRNVSFSTLQAPQLNNGFPPRYARQKTGSPKNLVDTALAWQLNYITTLLEILHLYLKFSTSLQKYWWRHLMHLVTKKIVFIYWRNINSKPFVLSSLSSAVIRMEVAFCHH